MLKNKLFYATVVALLLTLTGVTAVADYWTWTHTFQGTAKSTTTGEGFFPSYQPSVGAMNPAYGDYGQQNTIQTSPADDSTAATYCSMADAGDVLIRPDGFSFNNDIAGWLASDEHALRYSVVNLYNENGPITAPFASNDAVRVITAQGLETMIQQTEPRPGIGGTLGVYDQTWYTSMSNSWQAGPLTSLIEYAMGDFQVTASAPAPEERIYFSAGRYFMRITDSFGNFLYKQMVRPNAAWGGGSDYQGTLHAGDVLTQYSIEGAPTRGMFEKAWKIAGTMVGDQFWNVQVGGINLKWNTWNGYVSTSSLAAAPEATGHGVVRDFLRYVFDITAVKVQDYDGDGVFDAGEDLILFSVMDDSAADKSQTYKNQWVCLNAFTGQYFDGDTIFLYNGATVVTYMDKESGIFYGQAISTGTATIWGQKWGEYELTGFDLTYVGVPEPSTMILIAGATLALGAGILRKRIR